MTEKRDRVLVSGGAGFIGSHLVDTLLRANCRVLVVDDLSTGTLDNLKEWSSHPQLDIVEESLLADSCATKIMDFRPSNIVHLAAQMNVRRSVREPVFDAEQNILSSIKLLELAKDLEEVPHVIFSSTGGAIYGEQEVFPASEDIRIRPECPYGISKRSTELYLEWYSRTYDMSCTSLRFANVFGPRQNPAGEAGVVAIFFEKLLAKLPVVINGDGQQTRDFIYVDDVVKAVTTCLAMKDELAAYDVFNIGTGIETSINSIAETLSDIVPGVRNAPERGPQAVGEQLRSVLDSRKFSEKTGWKPSTTVEDGLRLTYDYLIRAETVTSCK